MQNDTTVCEKHPDQETALRCNRCERYMCAQCAVQTPVGYRCRECVRQVEDRFFTGERTDYLVMFGVAGVLAGVSTFLIGFIGFLLVLVFAAVLLGPSIGEAAWRAVGRRKSRYTREVVMAGTATGALIGAVFWGLPLFYVLYAFGLAFMAGARFRS